MAIMTKTPTSSIKDVLKIMDRCLGSFTAIIFISTFIYNLIFGLELTGPLFILFFLLFNLSVSQVSIRVKSSQKIELFRHFITLTLLCPLSVIIIKEPFAPFWYLYLIMIVSSSTIFFEVTRGHLYSIYISCYGILSYIIVSLYFAPNKSNIDIALHVWLMAMVALLFHQVLILIDKSYKREQVKSLEL